MQAQFTTEKLIEIYCQADDLCRSFETWLLANHPELYRPNKGSFSDAEVLTVVICYHLSGFKCFEYYYRQMILIDLADWFPSAPSYSYFLQLQPRVQAQAYFLQQQKAAEAARTGFYFVDSKKLPVCDNRRIHAHKVFDGFAGHGKSSTGWFYGFKIHLVINQLGEIVAAETTPGNVADNNPQLLTHLLAGLKGKCVGDKGYQTGLFQKYYEQGLHLIVKPKKNMKSCALPMVMKDKLLAQKRGLIESVNDLLMTLCDIDHTRHRSPANAFVNLFAGLIAYSFFDNRPTLLLEKLFANL